MARNVLPRQTMLFSTRHLTSRSRPSPKALSAHAHSWRTRQATAVCWCVSPTPVGSRSFVQFRGGQEVERSTFVSGLSRPFGMATTPGYFYVGNTNSVVRYAFDGRQTVLSSAGEQIMTLQGGGHWTRNLEVSAL